MSHERRETSSSKRVCIQKDSVVHNLNFPFSLDLEHLLNERTSKHTSKGFLLYCMTMNTESEFGTNPKVLVSRRAVEKHRNRSSWVAQHLLY
jgi:hypothetical protein